MIKLVRLTPELANELLDGSGMETVRETIKPEYITPLCAQKHSYAGVDVYGRVVFCVGVIELWPERGEAWAFFSQDAGVHFMAIHRIVKRFLFARHFKRIEATVELNFPRGIRWVEMLGFKVEAPCLAQYREGQDYALYSFIS